MKQNTWIALGGAIVAIAILAGGYYYLENSTLREETQQQEAQNTIVPKPHPSPATAPVAAKPAPVYAQNGEYDDYYNADGSYVYDRAAPPPPPDSFMRARRKPRDEFSGGVKEARLLHRGSGTQSAPMVWTARTSYGGTPRANLTFTAFVPEPGKDDGPAFWKRWYGHTNIAPRVTQGTNVVVVGNVAARVKMDPANLDLQKDAKLRLTSGNETRVYQSKAVRPAGSRVWDNTGVVWTYQPDADFYRLLKAHAAVSLVIPYNDGRKAGPVAIPFSMTGFAKQAAAFDRHTRKNLQRTAAAWENARTRAPHDQSAANLHELDRKAPVHKARNP